MASLPPDPWKALGVDKTADKSEIRNAYKKLVLKCHPDKVQDQTLKAQKQEEFQKVQQAYELLNDDSELAKYEEQVKLMELRRQAAMMAKNMANSSSSRTPARHYDIRAAEPRQKVSNPVGASKIYTYTSVHSRSHEEMPSRMYFDDGEKQARRSASFRDEERRDKDDRRRSKREEEERLRDRDRREKEIREREKELREREREQAERDARRADRRRADRERDKERKRDADDKRRQKSPYIEQYDSEDQQAFSSSKTEKKRSPSKKPYETERERPREKSTASRRPASPHVETVQPMPAPVERSSIAPVYDEMIDKAASYIERSKQRTSSRAAQDSFYTIPAPTPPPADAIRPPPADDDDTLRASIRAAGRRSSQEASRSKEKLPSKFNVVEAVPKGRPSPGFHKSHTTPLSGHEGGSSPPRISRSSTTPLEYAASAPHIPPKFGRTQTWGGPGGDPRHEMFVPYEGEDSEDDRHHHQHRHRRSSRRTRSPEPTTTRYKVDGHSRSSKLDSQYAVYGESPSGRRYIIPDVVYDTTSSYPPQMKVRETRAYTHADVKYSEVPYNYTAHAHDQYPSVYA